MSARFDMRQHEDGQVYITEAGEQMHHVQINGPHDVEVQVGVSGKVTVDKLYGPLVFWPLRVSLDADVCEWVIEREYGPQGEWREAARIPGQLEEDFSLDGVSGARGGSVTEHRQLEEAIEALEHIAVHGDHDQECHRPPQDCAADALARLKRAAEL